MMIIISKKCLWNRYPLVKRCYFDTEINRNAILVRRHTTTVAHTDVERNVALLIFL